MRKTISIDIDGVLAQFTRAFVPAINNLFPEKKVPFDFEPNDWLYSEVMSEAELKEALKVAFSTPFFWSQLDAYEDNLRTLQNVIADNKWHGLYDIYYVTARSETPGDSALALTSQWLYNHKIKPCSAQVLLVKDPRYKPTIMQGLKIETSVDDYLPTVVACQEIPNHEAYLLDRPWNRKGRPEGLKVVSSLEEYFAKISEINLTTK